MTKVAGLLGVGTTETARKWVQQAEIGDGARPGVTTEDSTEVERLKREEAKLERATRPPSSSASTDRAAFSAATMSQREGIGTQLVRAQRADLAEPLIRMGRREPGLS